MDVISSVEFRGAGPNVALETQVGQPFDEKTIDDDVHQLWSMGRFEDIRVEANRERGGTAVIFRLTPSNVPRLREVRVEPSTYGVHVNVPEGIMLDPRRAHEIAAETRKKLDSQGYRDAQIDYAVVPVASRLADLRLTISARDPLKVKNVDLTGASAIDEIDLRGALRALRAHRILFWRMDPAYSEEAVDSDSAGLVSLYLSRGYFDATVRGSGSGNDVHFSIEEGRSDDAPPVDCASLFAQRRAAERKGVLDFSARVNVATDLQPRVERGQPYWVGHIRFLGNHHYSDAAIRSYFVLNEAAPFDQYLLRQSLARLNRTNWFETLTDTNVAIIPDKSNGTADITIRLTERKRGKWSLSGPVGPTSIGGPLQASLRSRIASYTFSIGLVALEHPVIPIIPVKRFVYTLSFERSGMGWMSGITIAPQLGWQAAAMSYAAAQLRQRLTPVLAGDRGLVPDLPVLMETSNGEKTLMCKAPTPRFSVLRRSAIFALQISGSLGL